MYCSSARYPTKPLGSSPFVPKGSVYGVGPTVGPVLTYEPSSYCEQFAGVIHRAPAYATQYYSSYTPCSGSAQYAHSPCSMYSTQSSCGGNATGYHTMTAAYGASEQGMQEYTLNSAGGGCGSCQNT
jgi:hypothetical protein